MACAMGLAVYIWDHVFQLGTLQNQTNVSVIFPLLTEFKGYRISASEVSTLPLNPDQGDFHHSGHRVQLQLQLVVLLCLRARSR